MVQRFLGVILFLAASVTAGQGFEGNWTLSSPVSPDPYSLEITFHTEGYYIVKGYHDTPDLSWYGEGLEAFGYFAYVLGVDVPAVHIYQMQDSVLSGLATGYKGEELYTETSSKASGEVAELEPGEADLSGTWTEVEKHGDTPFTLRLAKNEYTHPALWIATISNEGEVKGGYGIISGDILAIGVLGDSGRTLAILKIEENNLSGNWLCSRASGEDYENREFDVVTIKLERQKE